MSKKNCSEGWIEVEQVHEGRIDHVMKSAIETLVYHSRNIPRKICNELATQSPRNSVANLRGTFSIANVPHKPLVFL